ncbi:MAG: hypothetical protein JWM10_492 [Myxococcaceae bacterium]|nr:hypothetical protein [Myxococcaceae bacterium]
MATRAAPACAPPRGLHRSFMRALVFLLALAVAWLLSACATPLTAIARRQFSQDHRCNAEDIRVDEDRGRYRVAGCGRRDDYVCASEPSTSVLEDRARCERAADPNSPWPAPATAHAAATLHEPRAY